MSCGLEDESPVSGSVLREPVATEAKDGVGATQVPLCVDLDGTLLRTDTLLESILQLVRRAPLNVVRLLAWRLRGKPVLKAEVARRVELDATSLPERAEFLAWIQQQKDMGRKLVLCTGAASRVAHSMTERFPLFDHVLCSDANSNLSGRTKALRLVAEFGGAGFDYAGNALRDLHVWRAARSAIVVAPTLPLKLQIGRVPRIERLFQRSLSWRAFPRAIRAHQWTKNILVFAPVVGAHLFADPRALTLSALAFMAFCVTASGTYIVNDLLDLPSDRHHPAKRLRPFANGELTIAEGAAAAAALITTGFLIGYAGLGWKFCVVLSTYLLVTLWYSLSLKRRAITDILCLASLYTLRILGGSAATGIEPSFWLLAFSMFLFLSLAAAKRSAELGALDSRKEQQAGGRGYTVQDLPLLLAFGVAAAYSSVLVLALYIFHRGEILYARPEILWLLCPALLYWVSRIWLKTYRRQLHEDPVVFALTDRPSLLIALASAALVWLAT